MVLTVWLKPRVVSFIHQYQCECDRELHCNILESEIYCFRWLENTVTETPIIIQLFQRFGLLGERHMVYFYIMSLSSYKLIALVQKVW